MSGTEKVAEVVVTVCERSCCTFNYPEKKGHFCTTHSSGTLIWRPQCTVLSRLDEPFFLSQGAKTPLSQSVTLLDSAIKSKQNFTVIEKQNELCRDCVETILRQLQGAHSHSLFI